MEGFLTKQGGVFRTWKQRWFTLDGNLLSYFKDKSDSNPAGKIDLSVYSFEIIGEEVMQKKNCFKLYGPGLRTYYLYAETRANLEQWSKHLSKINDGGSSAAAPKASRGGGGLGTIGEDDEITEFVAAGVPRTRMEDFDMIKVIGRGAFGKVMLVKKKEGGQLFALKILSKEMLIRRNQVQRTKAENQILQQLDHPFLVGLKFAFQSGSKLYLVMDYVNGGDLFTHLQAVRRFDTERCRLYAAEMVLAFEHLHSLGIVYRDLKPENILMGSDGHIRLTDFGLSKSNMQAGATTASFCGTPEYLAPEVLENKGYGKDVDWWSLGILIYEMMIGRPPFYSDNVQEMYSKILNQVVKFPPDVPEDAKSFISGLLSRDPKQRLGYGPTDSESIRVHPYFKNIDWDALVKKEIEPTFKPSVKGDTDTSNFDRQFTSEPVQQTPASSVLDAKAQEGFSGFTFTADSQLSSAARE